MTRQDISVDCGCLHKSKQVQVKPENTVKLRTRIIKVIKLKIIKLNLYFYFLV